MMLCHRVIDKFSNPLIVDMCILLVFQYYHVLVLGRFVPFSPGVCKRSDCYSFWFPAAGRRMNDSGSFNNVTSNGFYWSSSPNASGSNNGGNLNFNSNGNINPQNNYKRSYGLSVRCVSEFIRKMSAVLMLMFYLWVLAFPSRPFFI